MKLYYFAGKRKWSPPNLIVSIFMDYGDGLLTSQKGRSSSTGVEAGSSVVGTRESSKKWVVSELCINFPVPVIPRMLHDKLEFG